MTVRNEGARFFLPLRTSRGWILLLRRGALAALVFDAVYFALQRLAIEIGYDFLTYFGAALALRAGADPYSLAAIQHVAAQSGVYVPAPYLYPPLLALLLVPTTWLPYMVASRLWILLLVAVWIGSVWLLTDLVARLASSTSGEQRWWLLLAMGMTLTYGPLRQAIALGQISALLPAGLTLLFWLDARGGQSDERWLAIVLSILGWLKLFPFKLLPWYALRGRWNVVRGTLLWTTLLGVPQLLLLGPARIGSMFRAVLGFGTGEVIPGTNPWANEALALVPARLASFLEKGLPTWAGWVLPGVVTGITLYGLWLMRRYDRRLELGHDLLGAAWLLAAVVLVLPVAWYHYYAWLIPCAALGCAWCWRNRTAIPRSTIGLVALGFLLTIYDGVTSTSLGVQVLLATIRPIGALCLWAGLGLAFLRSRTRSGGEVDNPGTEVSADNQSHNLALTDS